MQDENLHSPYLDKLRGEIITGESLISGLEQELRGEIARALKESEDKVNWALLQCDLILKSEKTNARRHTIARTLETRGN